MKTWNERSQKAIPRSSYCQDSVNPFDLEIFVIEIAFLLFFHKPSPFAFTSLLHILQVLTNSTRDTVLKDLQSSTITTMAPLARPLASATSLLRRQTLAKPLTPVVTSVRAYSDKTSRPGHGKDPSHAVPDPSHAEIGESA